MPHYRVILHALHNLSFSFRITFTFAEDTASVLQRSSVLFREICICCENHGVHSVDSVVSPDAGSQSTSLADSCVYYKRNLIRQIRAETRINFRGCDDAGKICPCMAPLPDLFRQTVPWNFTVMST